MEQILKASYGDKGQREANAKAAAAGVSTQAQLQAARVAADYRERRLANPRSEVPRLCAASCRALRARTIWAGVADR